MLEDAYGPTVSKGSRFLSCPPDVAVDQRNMSIASTLKQTSVTLDIFPLLIQVKSNTCLFQS